MRHIPKPHLTTQTCNRKDCMVENLSHHEFKTELADGLQDLVEQLRQLDEKIQLRLDSEPHLSSDTRERLAHIQSEFRAPQGYFSEAANFVRRWL